MDQIQREDKSYEELKLRNQICFPLYACSRLVIRKYRPYLDAIDLTYTQYIAMMVFWEEKQLNVKELGKRLLLDSGTLTPLLKSLEAKGFVRRHRSEADERVLLVEITPEGEALREKAASVPSKMMGCLDLTPDEAMELYRLLYKAMATDQ